MRIAPTTSYSAWLVIILLAASTIGWIANVVQLAGSSFDPLTGIVVLRVIGVFVPMLGAVLGYL